jgi:hypothetical protein
MAYKAEKFSREYIYKIVVMCVIIFKRYTVKLVNYA